MNTKTKHALTSGALFMAVSTLIVKIIGVMYKVPLSHMIGEEGMGYFNSAYTVYGFFYVISSAGIPKAITMTVAQYPDEDSKLESICRALLKAFAIFGLILTFILFIAARPITLLMGNDRSLITMLAIAPSILLVTLSGVLRGYMNGRSRLLPIAISQLIEAACKLIFGLAFAHAGMRAALALPIISALAILGITIGSFFSLLYMYLSCFGVKVRRDAYRLDAIRRTEIVITVIKKAAPITLSAAISAISGVLDMFTVMNGLRAGGYSADIANSTYGNYSTLAVPMISLVGALLMPITMVMLPKLSKSAPGDLLFNTSLTHGWTATLALAAPMSTVLSLYSFEILDLLFPSTQSANGAPALSILSLAALLLPLLSVVNTALEASGKTGKALLSLALGLGVKALLGAILIPIPKFGITGAAISSVASYAFSLLISVASLGKCKQAINPGETLFIIVLVTLAFIPPFLLIYSFNIFGISTLSMVISVAVSSILYLCLCIPTLLRGKLSDIIMHKKNSLFSEQSF